VSGFITESVSKISDGFGSAIKMLALVGLTALAIIPVRSLFGLAGVVGLSVLLFLLSVYYFYRSLRNQMEDQQKAWCGMAAGVLLWQVTRYLPEVPGWGWLDKIGFLYWMGLFILTILLWKKVLPIGLKFMLSTFLLNWIGRLYLKYLDNINLWPRTIALIFPYLRYLGILGILVSIWWIAMRSRNSIERKYGGLALYFCVLLTFLFF
jgi:hypothetical protein